MIISRVNYVSCYSNKFQTVKVANPNKNQTKTNLTSGLNLSFGSYGHYEIYDESRPDQNQYSHYKSLYGRGYGRTEYSQQEFERDWAREHSRSIPSDSITSCSCPPGLLIRENLSLMAIKYMRAGMYKDALKEKLAIAQNCKKHGEPENAFLLEESVRGLYTKIRPCDKDEIIEAIREYNPDMARYIDQDIAANPGFYESKAEKDIRDAKSI